MSLTSRRKYLLLFSFSLIVLAGAFLGWGFKYYLTETVLTHTEEKSVAIAKILSVVTIKNFAELAKHANIPQSTVSRDNPAFLAIDLFAKSVVAQRMSIYKIKIFDLNSQVLYSTFYGEIGIQSKVVNTNYLSARAGQIVSVQHFRKPRPDDSAYIFDRQVISSYIPVLDPLHGKVIGVFELYTDVTSVLATLEHHMVLFTVGLLLVITLVCWIVYTVASRFSALARQNAEEILEKQQKVFFAEYHDSMTGLPNRALFLDRLRHGIAKVDRQRGILAVMYINIDRFKMVNEGLGYKCGDNILKMASDRLKKAVRECDTVGRIGGDEFAIILEGIGSINEAAHVAKRVESSLSAPFEYENQELGVSVSIGISIYPDDEKNEEYLLSHADVAMHRIKDQGGASFQFYTSDMNVSSGIRIIEEQKLRNAIQKNEYRIYFQPVVNVQTGTLVGMEALLRWQMDDQTLVLPGKFISLLEESGLIVPVGEWVLREACLQTKRWIDQGYGPLVVSVNVSVRQFRQLDFVDVVYKILDETGLAPCCLQIEVTEGVLMEDTQASKLMLDGLKALGITLAIDDFGTGYSSLSYLKSYPIDTLKIDRVFVSGIEDNNEGAAIASTIVALARNLKLNIIAEGVETHQQMTFLLALGCHVIQGYFFSHPVSGADFEQILKNRTVLFKNIPDFPLCVAS